MIRLLNNEILRLVSATLMARVCDRNTSIVLQDGQTLTVKACVREDISLKMK